MLFGIIFSLIILCAPWKKEAANSRQSFIPTRQGLYRTIQHPTTQILTFRILYDIEIFFLFWKDNLGFFTNKFNFVHFDIFLQKYDDLIWSLNISMKTLSFLRNYNRVSYFIIKRTDITCIYFHFLCFREEDSNRAIFRFRKQ